MSPLEELWDTFEKHFEPGRASKTEYAEALRELIDDARIRLEAVESEIEEAK